MSFLFTCKVLAGGRASVTRHATGLLVGRLVDSSRWERRVLALRRRRDRRRSRPRSVSWVNTLPTMPCDADYAAFWYTMGPLRRVYGLGAADPNP